MYVYDVYMRRVSVEPGPCADRRCIGRMPVMGGYPRSRAFALSHHGCAYYTPRRTSISSHTVCYTYIYIYYYSIERTMSCVDQCLAARAPYHDVMLSSLCLEVWVDMSSEIHMSIYRLRRLWRSKDMSIHDVERCLRAQCLCT